MNSTNATALEFDFTPIAPNFSFDFLFASEEYGNFQCQFSDAFAFLLTNTLTGETVNLAVVPGTNLPISVVTIRDFLYNSSCPSQNAAYFGAYNGGSAAAQSATVATRRARAPTAASCRPPGRASGDVVGVETKRCEGWAGRAINNVSALKGQLDARAHCRRHCM